MYLIVIKDAKCCKIPQVTGRDCRRVHDFWVQIIAQTNINSEMQNMDYGPLRWSGTFF